MCLDGMEVFEIEDWFDEVCVGWIVVVDGLNVDV